ncbi:hypothetical protein [Flavobacterium granuli]|uniref:Uncharacterized protein n=1 Tax=Flavobacterium granuli TaxID=280093 RepID=A0ABU1S0K8_9FLAO|nr:hypothetical protein [Flavobacterium granuli]MDR6844567.1 hypothetical protein [Flavobacterium granuli]
MKNLLTPLFIIAFVLISCKNETENQTPKVVVPFTQVANAQTNQTVAAPQPSILYQQNDVNKNTATQPQTQTQTQTVAAPVKVAKGMNPPHGQPGHRCDIPVGSPLNSPVATNSTASQVVPNSGQTVTTTTMTPAKTAKGMNPPHGQPGHRCDIPVGSPLNSPVAAEKPATPQVVPNYIVSPPATTETPAETTPPAAVTGQ